MIDPNRTIRPLHFDWSRYVIYIGRPTPLYILEVSRHGGFFFNASECRDLDHLWTTYNVNMGLGWLCISLTVPMRRIPMLSELDQDFIAAADGKLQRMFEGEEN